MKNRNIYLLASLLLSVPTGYVYAAAESAKGLALRLAAEARKTEENAETALLINQALATDESRFSENNMQCAIAQSLDPADTDNKEQEEVKEKSAEVVAARAAGRPITLQKANTNKKWYMPNTATYTKKPTTKRGETLVEMIASNTVLSKEIAGLIENYEKSVMREQIINASMLVKSIAIAPDGNSIAAVIDSEITIYNAENGTPSKTLKNPGPGVRPIFSVAFSPNGQQIVSGSLNGIIHILNIETDECLRTLKNECHIRSVAFSPDGQQIITEAKHDGSKCIWDVETGKCLYLLKAKRTQNFFSIIAFSPDAQHAASKSDDNDNNMDIWNIETDQNLHKLEGHQQSISSITFSPNGQYIASGSSDKTVRIWNVKTGTCLHTLNVEGNYNSIQSIQFSPDGQHIVFTTYNQIYIFDISKVINNIDFIYEIVAPEKVGKKESKTRKNPCDSCVIS